MLLSLFENIRQLTTTANKCIKDNQIEQCYIALAERQKLLEELNEQVIHPSTTSVKIKNDFIELIRWIQQQDKPNIDNLEFKKQDNIQKSIKQVQTNKAIQQYKSV